MLSRLDFIAKQLVVIDSNNKNKLRFKNSNLVLVNESDKIILQNSLTKIFCVFIIGEFSITSVLVKKAKKYNFSFVFLNYNLKPYYNISFENKGNFVLRKKQYYFQKALSLSQLVVKNKIENQIILLDSLRYKTQEEKKSIISIKKIQAKVDLLRDEYELLGLEGNAAKIFFKVYFKNLDFEKRMPRTKLDIFNLLFDIGYSYLFNFIEANLELYGFDIYYGFYHKLFYQRKSLVCDIIEPFRAIVDRKIKKGFNLKQIDKNDFYTKNSQFFIKREFNKKYTRFFLEEILKQKEAIFLYVQQFYRNFMKEADINNFPKFLIKK